MAGDGRPTNLPAAPVSDNAEHRQADAADAAGLAHEQHSHFIWRQTRITADGNLRSPARSVQIDGACRDLHVDDRVEIVGWISRPQSPSNPGEWDYATFLANQGIRAELHAESPVAVQLLSRPAWWSLARWREEVVRRAGQALHAYLPAREAALAEALLLGSKAALSRNELEPFLTSGTLHLLVVSGWHIAPLALIVWRTTNVLLLSW